MKGRDLGDLLAKLAEEIALKPIRRQGGGRPTSGGIVERENGDGSVSFVLRAQVDGRRVKETFLRVAARDRAKGRRLAEAELTRRRFLLGQAIGAPPAEDRELNDAAADFIEWCSRRLSRGTTRRYRAVLDNARESGLFPECMSDVRHDHVEAYLQARSREHTASGVNYELATLRRWWRWCSERPRAWVAHDPFDGVRALTPGATGRRGKKVLTAGEVEAFRAVAPEHVRAAFDFALNTGLRSAELIYLDAEDVNTKGRVVRVLSKIDEGHETKTRRERMVPMSDEALEVWRAWRAGRSEPEAFPAPVTGGRWKKLGEAVRYWMARANVPASLHTARHTFCTNALKHTGDVHAVMVWMGHENLRTTMEYLHHLPEQHREALRHFRSPR